MFPFYLQYLKYDILLLTGNKHHFLVISLSSLSFSVSLCYAAMLPKSSSKHVCLLSLPLNSCTSNNNSCVVSARD
uniref:Uncharacterized protein n=1 Tax=Aegilops tauschii subsp. strangulata TaxID=200361 RepID=A0A453S655_AEGTS